MSDLEAERDGWQRAVQGASVDEAPPLRVFPDHIHVDLEGFRRTIDPFYQPGLPTTSSLYKSRVISSGRIFCTRRMQQWLQDLPEPPEIRPEPRPEPSSETPLSSNRPRAQSTSVSGLSGASAPGLGNDLIIPSPTLQHPNPLGQHPVQHEVHPELQVPSQLEEVHPQIEVHPQLEAAYFQPQIPQRRSSLYFSTQPASHALQSQHPLHHLDYLFQGLEQLQVDETEASEDKHSQISRETSEQGSIGDQTKRVPKMQGLTRSANKRDTVHFGSMLDDLKEHLPIGGYQEDDHVQSAMVADDDEEEPPKSLFGSVRHRRSMAGTPAADLNDGRKSSASVMKDMSKSSKNFLDKLTARNTDQEDYRLSVAFIGDRHCGKSTLLGHYTLGSYIDGTVHQPDVNTFRMQLTGALSVDNFTASMDIFDIVHQNVIAGKTHPLVLKQYDVVIICVDIGDQRNLESVAKWRLEIQRYCPGVPSVLLGLKADLRPNCPTLRLGFLNESIASTVGQGEKVASENNAAAYYECSAQTGEGVTEFFESLVRFSVQTILNRNNLRKRASRKFSNLFGKG